MNINKTTTIIVLLGILASAISSIIPYVPAEYVMGLTIALSLISELTNALKSGFEDKTETPADDENAA